ncbi:MULTISPECIES: B12-binding domain-containing radical SAM protein [Nocardia]|uniref:B12-binding domain-containing radical SAM protein n=1 Tax=Nocardia TaxID=1817 RepID=UPI001C12B680|nr:MULTISPECIES: hypothetical protein [Nocardia]UEX23543.1 hypothetical protein LMJ57_03305 [Nocardia farcinica]
MERSDHAVSPVGLTTDGHRRLAHPHIKLVGLYHPEFFPLPRFPLGISDLARSVRATLLGVTSLVDMQLGTSMDELLEHLESDRPEILGISATFGQHDLLEKLLAYVESLVDPPMVVAGGSLVARNERSLLADHPTMLVARGAGEPTIQDVAAYWHGDIAIHDVRGIGYAGGPRGTDVLTIRPYRKTAVVPNRLQTDILPELDLLEPTLRSHGVAQLEGSRGCTNFCSFCPRGHKGSWCGSTGTDLSWILDRMHGVFQRHPHVSRTIYFVDEEFIGEDDRDGTRTRELATQIHSRDFRWETSCRVDQVVDPDRDRDWHLARIRLWRDLPRLGLRRCLFGIESGVTTILDRFNKETTAEQNAKAIRTLSILGVPTRFTYITFDHLMSFEELEESVRFQGRTDLILRRDSDIDDATAVDRLDDDEFVRARSGGVPFYQGISYMLVNMECLIGAAYTRKVVDAGLAGEIQPSMGRVDAEYADWRIGVLADSGQRWIDRNFALDYTLKSLEKILDGHHKTEVRSARVLLKDAAYRLLVEMVDLAREFDLDVAQNVLLADRVREAMDAHLQDLADSVSAMIDRLANVLSVDENRLLAQQYANWTSVEGWELINAADFCE